MVAACPPGEAGWEKFTGGHISVEPRINERIRVPEVRLVGPNGKTIVEKQADPHPQSAPGWVVAAGFFSPSSRRPTTPRP